MSETLRRCRTCQQSKPPAEFYRKSHHRNGKETECRACQKARNTHNRRVKGIAERQAGKKSMPCLWYYAILDTPCGPRYPLRVFTWKELRSLVLHDRLAIGAVVERQDGVRLRVTVEGLERA